MAIIFITILALLLLSGPIVWVIVYGQLALDHRRSGSRSSAGRSAA
jgi:hypothetical protein